MYVCVYVCVCVCVCVCTHTHTHTHTHTQTYMYVCILSTLHAAVRPKTHCIPKKKCILFKEKPMHALHPDPLTNFSLYIHCTLRNINSNALYIIII